MSSTGEVACFGQDKNTAYLKAMMSSGYKLPQKNILLSIGAYKHKEEMKESVRLLDAMGFKLFGSYNTADYYNQVFKDQNIAIQWRGKHALCIYSPPPHRTQLSLSLKLFRDTMTMF